MLTAYDIHDRFAFFFRSARARTDDTYDFSLAEAARATVGGADLLRADRGHRRRRTRTYPLIDGGIYAINPAMCAYAEVAPDLEVLASLGTGSHTKPYEFADVKGWGKIEWVQPLIDMVFDGIADTIDFEAGHAGRRPLQALPGRAALRLRRARRRQRVQPPPARGRRRAPDRRAHGRDRGALRGHRGLRHTLGIRDARAPLRQVHVPEGRPGLAPARRRRARRPQARVPRRLRGLRRRAPAARVLDRRHARRLPT